MRIYLSDPDSAATALTERLQTELKDNKRVLWLVSGGSNISATVSILNNIPEDLTHNLSLMPVDERYGQPGHAGSNWQQLMAAGLDPKRAAVFPVLQADATFDAARLHYEAIASRLFAGCDIVVAQLGMGTDGHIAGILPSSPAVDDTRLVCAYESQPYRRLTLTFEA